MKNRKIKRLIIKVSEFNNWLSENYVQTMCSILLKALNPLLYIIICAWTILHLTYDKIPLYGKEWILYTGIYCIINVIVYGWASITYDEVDMQLSYCYAPFWVVTVMRLFILG